MFILKISKDGRIGYGTEPYKDNRGRKRVDFLSPMDLRLGPYAYETEKEAEAYGKKWQMNFPAEAQDWDLEVEYYGR